MAGRRGAASSASGESAVAAYRGATLLSAQQPSSLEAFARSAAQLPRVAGGDSDSGSEGSRSSSGSGSGSGSDSEGGEEVETLADFPLLVFGSNARDQLGIADPAKVEMRAPEPVRQFGKAFRVGNVSSGARGALLTNEATGTLFECSSESQGAFQCLDCNDIFMLDVAATSCTNFALSGKRQIYSWGSARYGQLGRVPGADELVPRPSTRGSSRGDSRGSRSRREGRGRFVPMGLVRKLASFRVSQLATGRFHVVALLAAGGVFSWGRNNNGQLGHGDLKERAEPCAVDALDGCFVMYVAAAGEQSAAVGDTSYGRHFGKKVNAKNKRRVVFTWGLGDDGRLGHERRDGDKLSTEEAETPAAEAPWRARSTSTAPEQRPTTPQRYRSVPQFVPNLLGSESAVHKLALGEAFGLALTESGQVWAWGDNTYGQLGLGHNYSEAEPVLVEAVSNIVQVAAGRRHSAFLTSQGAVLTCGFNRCGELGHGDGDARVLPTPLVSLAEDGFEARALHCGAEHTAVWTRVPSRDTALCFQEALRQRQCRLTGPVPQAPCTVIRDAPPDGFAFLALAGPATGSGTQRWRVQVDRVASAELPVGIGVVSLKDADPFMFDTFDQGSSWLYLSSGDKMHLGDIESYAEPFYNKDIIDVHLDLDLGVLRFARRGRDAGVCYYLSSSEPLYLCVSLSAEEDQLTLLPDEEEDRHVLVDPGTTMCYNDEGLHKTTGIEVFHRCSHCNIRVCRACARLCEHARHCCELSINHAPRTQLCECQPATCQARRQAL